MTDGQDKDQMKVQARQFIDEIIEINRKYGFDVDLSERDYKQAVRDAARAPRRLAEGQGNAES